LATSKAGLITTHYNIDAPAEFYAVSFSPDGRKVYMLTDNENDFYRLACYDIDDESLEYLEYPFLEKYANWDINTAVFSHNKSKMALVVNTDGYDKLFLYDMKREKEIKIPAKLKSTSITALSFSNKDDRLIVGINSAANPSVLYEWTFSSGTVEQLTYPSLAGINPGSFIEPSLIH
jgi:WD40 repeat protein